MGLGRSQTNPLLLLRDLLTRLLSLRCSHCQLGQLEARLYFLISVSLEN